MNRILKFRAWDTLNEEFVPEQFCINKTGKVLLIDTGKEWMSAPDDFVFHLNQSTGLNDRNGKEIYEGDIVNVTFPNGGFVRAVFEWHRNGWYYKILFALDDSINSKPFASYPYPNYSNNYVSYKFEVIGNIYENPELLNL